MEAVAGLTPRDAWNDMTTALCLDEDETSQAKTSSACFFSCRGESVEGCKFRVRVCEGGPFAYYDQGGGF